MATKSFIKTIGSKGLLADYNTEGKKLQTELTAGDNITIDGDNISSNQVFVAEYGKTKYAEVKAAYEAGKICTLFKDKRYYYLRWIDESSFTFTTSNGTDKLYSFNLNTADYWSTYTGYLQTKLTAGDNITIDGDTISSNQVFAAAYGKTKYQEIKDAYDAGKICLCKNAKLIGTLYAINDSVIRFQYTKPNQGYMISYSVSNNNIWTYNEFGIQSKLTFDKAPKAGSNNPVTSDGIKTALDSRVPAPTSTTGTQVLKCIDGVIQWVTE